MSRAWWPRSPRGERPQDPVSVLVVDDDPATRAVVRAALNTQSWQIFEASTTNEGLALAEQRRPTVILLDVNFAGETRDGFAVCRELRTRKETKETPIVLFTAHDDAENRALASAVGATAFIAKPFGPLELLAMLRVVATDGPEPGVGLYLVDAGVITPSQLERAIAEQRIRQGPPTAIGDILVQLGYAKADDVRLALSRQTVARVRPKSMAAFADIRIVIADDHASVREALRGAMAAEDGLNVVGLAIDGDDALRLVRTLAPDVIVLDNDMPKRKGLDVARVIRTEAPTTAIVFFTLDESVREEAMAAGAASVVTKDQPLAALIGAVRRAGTRRPHVETNAGVVLATRAARTATGILERQRRRVAVLAVLGVIYAGAFLIAEQFVGPSASILGLFPVAIAGAAFGPETGVVAAMLEALLTAVLWQSTGHLLGEPVLTVGGNGLGVVALIGIGAGFGMMRMARGRLAPDARDSSAIAEAARLLFTDEPGRALGLLAQAATETVRGDAALLFISVPAGGTEVVAATSPFAPLVGSRARGDAVLRTMSSKVASVISADRAAIGVDVPRMRSAVAAPLGLDDGAAIGAIVVLSAARGAYGDADVATLASYARFVRHVITMRASAQPAVSSIASVYGATARR